MNYIKIDKNDIANGPGVRVVLWVSGCRLNCRGCHNPKEQDFNCGYLFDETTETELFEFLSKPYVQGITFTGGHPLEEENIDTIYELIHKIRNRFPEKDIWLYTGYTYESLEHEFKIYKQTPTLNKNIPLIRHEIIQNCDVVVDGPYIERLRDISLQFRGSSNQRLIDVQQTLMNNEVVLWNS